MRKLRLDRVTLAPLAAFLASVLALWSACGNGGEPFEPLLVISGPDDFTSFEIRDEGGETIWKLEADEPTRVAALFFGVVPEGFQQTMPSAGPPRPLEPGEDLSMESRIPNRVFLHRGYAESPTTVVILEWGVRREPPNAAHR